MGRKRTFPPKPSPYGQPALGDKPSTVRQRMQGDGLSVGEQGRTWERASVTTIHQKTHTCDVYTEGGKLVSGVAWPGAPRVLSPPVKGESVLVHFQAGTACLLTAPPMVSMPTGINSSASYGPGSSAATNAPSSDRSQPNLSGNGPQDLLPGDFYVAGPDGNHLGIYNGGVNALKSGEFAQVQTHRDKELVRVIGRVIQMFAGAGSLVLDNSSGKTSLVFQIGADEGAESNPLQENFRVRYSAGQDGNLSDFRITDGKGKSVFSSVVFPTGRSERTGLSDSQILSGDKSVVTQDYVADGRNFSGTYSQEVNFRSGSKMRLRSLGRMGLTAVNGMSLRSGGGMSLTSGNTLNATANGPLIPLPVNQFGTGPSEAIKFNASNGSVVFNIGDPTKGDTQVARSGFHVDTYTGDTRFSSVTGGFAIDGTGFVKLGGIPTSRHPLPVLPGPFGAVMHELLMIALQTMGTLLDTHVHPSPAGGFTAPPPVPIYNNPAVIGAFLASRSLLVSFGG